MNKIQAGYFFYRLNNKKAHFPLDGQIELTYRCNLNCVHCYCKGLESAEQELTTEEWKGILDMIQREGCLYLCLTGGDPLIRQDFLEIYSYAKKKGFFITLFTNGWALTSKCINYFLKSPPHRIEITLNGITKKTYESITGVAGSFAKVINTINLLKEKKMPLILKANCLKQNKFEIGRIKAFTEKLFDRLPRNRYRFQYDQMIYPRYNGDKTPCNYRLSPVELLGVKKQDQDIWEEYQESLDCSFPNLNRDRRFLYQCNAWKKRFLINPYGYLKFCGFSDKFSINLKNTTFKEGFYYIFPKLLNERFKTESKCKDCQLRPICYNCPARAYLEIGDEEAPVPYYCRLAREKAKRMRKSHVAGNTSQVARKDI
jgi:radical SAM protein with 4Fe4S-binding SPASM domain